MSFSVVRALFLVACLQSVPLTLHAQGRPDPAVLIGAQREAMKALAFMDGAWRGKAWTLLPSGKKHVIVQTERIGPLLDGTVKIIEGQGFEHDGKLVFNSLGTISFDPATRKFSMRSHAQGRAGDFEVVPTTDGFSWSIPAGPATIRYSATVKDGVWTEVGDRIMPDSTVVRFFEMTLNRVGNSDWPAGGALGPE